MEAQGHRRGEGNVAARQRSIGEAGNMAATRSRNGRDARNDKRDRLPQRKPGSFKIPRASLRRAAAALVLTSPVDPRKAFCHSPKRFDVALMGYRDRSCEPTSFAFAANRTPRDTAHALQIPYHFALSSAVQPN